MKIIIQKANDNYLCLIQTKDGIDITKEFLEKYHVDFNKDINYNAIVIAVQNKHVFNMLCKEGYELCYL